MSILENMNFDVNCPNCNESISVSGNDVGTTITCPYCNVDIELQDKNFTNTVNSIENQIDDILKNFL